MILSAPFYKTMPSLVAFQIDFFGVAFVCDDTGKVCLIGFGGCKIN